MVKRIVVTLEQSEYSALLDMAIVDLRNPADELRHILRMEIDRRNTKHASNNEKVREVLVRKQEAQ